MLKIFALVNPRKANVVPVTPLKTAIEVFLLRFFRILTGFLYQ